MKTLKTLTTQRKHEDVQVVVRVVEADGERFVDIRDYIPSTKTYGRGIMIPLRDAEAISAIGYAVVSSIGGKR